MTSHKVGAHGIMYRVKECDRGGERGQSVTSSMNGLYKEVSKYNKGVLSPISCSVLKHRQHLTPALKVNTPKDRCGI